MAISDKQMSIMAFPYTSYDALIADGAIRSGKTTFMIMAFVEDAMRRFNGQRFGICGRTVDSTVKNIIMPYMAMTGPKEKYGIQWKRSDKLLIVTEGDTENYFEVFGGKDESSFMLIQGRTLAGALFDEVALQPRSFVDQAMARCSVKGSKLWFNCNPGSPSHWFYKDWILEAKKHNALHLHFQLEDNPALDESIINRYKTMYSGVFYDRYIRGLWVSAEGLIYRDFATNTDKYLIDDPLEWAAKLKKRFTVFSIGVDFGGSNSATKFQATGITADGIVVALEEEYIKGDVDPDKLNKDFMLFIKAVTEKYGFGYTRADSAEQILIRGLNHTAQKNRLQTAVKNALKMPINDRIMLTLLLMKQGRLFVSKRCPHLIEAFQMAVYDSSKHEDERLDDGTSDIDSLDAFEYSIEPHYKALERFGFRR